MNSLKKYLKKRAHLKAAKEHFEKADYAWEEMHEFEFDDQERFEQEEQWTIHYALAQYHQLKAGLRVPGVIPEKFIAHVESSYSGYL